MLFGVGFRLVLVLVALVAERVGAVLRSSGVTDVLATLWPQDVGTHLDRLRAAFRRS